MANLQIKPENWRFCAPYCNGVNSICRNHGFRPNVLRLFAAKPRLELRVRSTSVKGKGDVVEGERSSEGLKRIGGSDESVSVLESDDEEVGLNWPPWKDIPQRYKLIGTTSLAFVICNMDKVNLSIAIIPMSHQFGWNSSTAGVVQSSFFWGYALSQLPGGWLAKIFGGKRVLEVGVLAWSIATIFVPFLLDLYLDLSCRESWYVGIGEGVSPSAATDLIARSIPLEERSRAVAFVFGGLSVGSVIGLLLAPPLIQTFGWESVFYLFGIFGIIWCLGFEFVEEKPSVVGEYFLRRSLNVAGMSQSWRNSFEELAGSLKDVPWKAFFQSPAVWAMIYAHFCGSWGHYTCLSWLPTYFSHQMIRYAKPNLGLALLAHLILYFPMDGEIKAAPEKSLITVPNLGQNQIRKNCVRKLNEGILPIFLYVHDICVRTLGKLKVPSSVAGSESFSHFEIYGRDLQPHRFMQKLQRKKITGTSMSASVEEFELSSRIPASLGGRNCLVLNTINFVNLVSPFCEKDGYKAPRRGVSHSTLHHVMFFEGIKFAGTYLLLRCGCKQFLCDDASEELNLNLTEAAWVSVLPPLASVVVTNLAAQFADYLISRGVENTRVRKICQTIAFLSPAASMTLSSIDFGLPPWEVVGILCAGLALSSFALSGLYCTHQDISPEYASVLLGITNTVGAVPGIVGVALTGYLLDSTHSWSSTYTSGVVDQVTNMKRLVDLPLRTHMGIYQANFEPDLTVELVELLQVSY
ncbi:hypothetical protein Syun_011174 [Stephania yunnanensis]|uniref:Major facilitator superfamily (MFS) profile domain-containing protein n=1 Tax=Stephania yunnanensis TaxID=152371 RepID=A0AAP0PG85_9MAGN